MPNKNIHRRGGAYKLRLMKDVTNWNGVLLNREILNHLKIGDNVRVIFEPDIPRYITITHILTDGYLMGYVDDDYAIRYCDICRSGKMIKGKPLYYCSNQPYCDFDCHLECLAKNPDVKCGCNINGHKLKKRTQYLMNGSVIIFKKNNISEIRDCTKNTAKLIDIYTNPNNIGYMFTGVR